MDEGSGGGFVDTDYSPNADNSTSPSKSFLHAVASSKAAPPTTSSSSTTLAADYQQPSSSSSVVINIRPSSSPCSPRLIHLRPQNPLMSPLEMQRINNLLSAEPVDPSKLSPISPQYPTSDLGSSPRSSISVTASASSSSTWGVFREHTKSSSDFTDGDSDCKDVFSPGFLLSPAPYSPFSDGPPETPSTGGTDFHTSAASPMFGGIGCTSSHFQRLRFTFDPKSPLFQNRGSQSFLLPPTSLSVVRERSRSDSETLMNTGISPEPSSVGPPLAFRHSQPYQYTNKAAVDADVVRHKKVKKDLLERYQTEVSSTKETNIKTHLDGHRRGSKTGVPQPSYHTSAYPTGVELPIVRVESNATSAERANEPPAPNDLQSQAYFNLWLNHRILEANSLQMWYPGAVTNAPPPPPMISPMFSQSSALFSNVRSIGSGHVIKPAAHVQQQQQYLRVFPPSTLALPQNKHAKRSRSESDSLSYICQHCGQSFSLYDRLGKHIASRHRDRSVSVESPLKTHKCTVCHKAFGRSDMLTRHMRLHTGIKPYSCRICGQVFSRSDHLSTHQRTHTGEKPYQCPQCSYAASRRDMITRHMRTHTRGRGYTSSSSSSTSSYHRLSSSDGSGAGGKQGNQDGASSSTSYISVIQQVGGISRVNDSGGGDSTADVQNINVIHVDDDDESEAAIVEKARRLCVSPMVDGGRVSRDSVSTIMADEDFGETTLFEHSSASSSTGSTTSELTPRIEIASLQIVGIPSTSDGGELSQQSSSSVQHSSTSKPNSPYDISKLAGSISEINVKIEPA